MPNFSSFSWNDRLPSETLDVSPVNYWEFFRTMYERQLVWYRRFVEGKPRPWTDDPILRDYKFTNVYRELDRSSQWQIRNIILDPTLTLKNLVWKIMFYRFFNNPATFETAREEMGWRNGIPDYDEFDPDVWQAFIDRFRDAGNNPFTNAYMINSAVAPGHTRNWCYSQMVLTMLHKRLPELMKHTMTARHPEDIIARLKTLYVVADFIAHEFYQDFTYIPRYTGRRFMPFDQNDFTNVGPGASVGLRLIFPSLKRQKEGIYRLRDEAPAALAAFGDFPYIEWDRTAGEYRITSKGSLTLHQIEMWLCEYSKYWKMIIGDGKQRSTFTPTTL